MATTKSKTSDRTDTYFDLIRAYALRSIRTEGEAARAGDVLSKLLMGKADEDRDLGERQYIDALSDLIGNYESKATFPDLPKTTPLGLLKFLMTETGMKGIDLGQIIGSQSNASEILNGKRGLSKAHIVKLARHFNVSPALFLEEI